MLQSSEIFVASGLLFPPSYILLVLRSAHVFNNGGNIPVTLSRISLQLSTSPIDENKERISSWVMVWGK